MTSQRTIRTMGLAGLTGLAAMLALMSGAPGPAAAQDAPRFPAPSTVSEEAQAILNAPVDFDARLAVPQTEAEWRAVIAARDAAVAQQVDAALAAAPVTVEETEMAGVTVRIVTPEGMTPEKTGKVLINVHGGAYVLFAGTAGLGEALRLALQGGYRVIAVDYRMPPDHPFPAAVDDTVAVYREALKTYGAGDMAIFGTSAGGGLAAAAALAIRDAGLPMPAAVAMNTPWSDLTMTGDSYATLEGLDPVLVTYAGFLGASAELYAGTEEMTAPLLSPVYADYGPGFPPAFLLTGTRDLFLSNTVRHHRALRRAGIEAELHVFEGMWHAFNGVPETDEAIAEMVRFFDDHLLE